MEIILSLITIAILAYGSFRVRDLSRTLVALGSDLAKVITLLSRKGIIKPIELDTVTPDEAESVYEERINHDR